MAGPNWPAGKKIHGTNIVIGGVFFQPLWESFAVNFPLLKAELQLAIATRRNVVRLWGNLQHVINGNITPSQYHSEWVEVLLYMRSIGMKCYLMGAWPKETAGLTNLQISTAIANLLKAIEDAGCGSDCIGCDLFNEIDIPEGMDTAAWPDTYVACRAAGVQMGLAVSTHQSIKDPANLIYATTFGPGPHAGKRGYEVSDWLDLHNYGTAWAKDDVVNCLAAWPYSTLIAGEFGKDTAEGESAIRTFLTTFGDTINTGHERFVGGLHWANKDYHPAITQEAQYGSYDTLGNAKPQYTEPLIAAAPALPDPEPEPEPSGRVAELVSKEKHRTKAKIIAILEFKSGNETDVRTIEDKEMSNEFLSAYVKETNALLDERDAAFDALQLGTITPAP